jgi:beta-glucanase (GH16 family)
VVPNVLTNHFAVDDEKPGATAVVPNGPAGAWKLIFGDEFNGDRLDTRRWLPCVSDGQLWRTTPCRGWNAELQTYEANNVVVRDGAMHLVARPTPDGRYTSGAVTTAKDTFGFRQPGYSDFTYRYGYLETRLRTPRGTGLWPAVWSLPYNGKGEEIDVLEVVKGLGYVTLHTGTPTGGGQQVLFSPDFTQGWHTVGTEWAPGRLTWYVDGQEVYTLTSEIPDQPFFVQANLAVGGSWPGPPDSSTNFPADLDIDYIRVFQSA